MNSEIMAALGFDHFFYQQILEEDLKAHVPVRVMNVQRAGLHLMGEAINHFHPLTSRDIDLHAVAGDWLLLDVINDRIIRLLDRKTCLKRRAPGTDRKKQLLAANIDTLFIVSSCNQDFNEARLERYLAITRESNIMAVIVLTKSDLATDAGPYVNKALKLMPGVQVEAVNALEKSQLEVLKPWLGKGQTVALLGSSGVGKSTISNTLLEGNTLVTREIRDDDAKGRHTTTTRSMYKLPGGAWLLDTPGMRELQLVDVNTALDDVFTEISELAEHCRFADCRHDNEPGCALKKAIAAGSVDPSRLKRWKKLSREDAFNSASLAERRAKDKALGRFYKSVIKGKQSLKER